jgi:hypothetical protein
MWQQAANDPFDLIRDDTPGGIIHELATTRSAGVFRLSRAVRTVFGDLVGLAVRTVAHAMLLHVARILHDSMLPLRFKDYLSMNQPYKEG